MEYYVNPYIKNTDRIFPGQGRYDYGRFDMNENIKGLPYDFVKEVLSEITPEFLTVYPEPDRFLNKYAEFIGVNRENLTATNGTDMAIRYILETFGEPGKDVLTVTPSFEMYRINCLLLGLNHRAVSYEEDFSIDIDKIIDAITDNTRIVVLLNPNNPMGNAYSMDDAKRIAYKASKMGAIVLIDEAYHYFYSETLLSLVIERDNVILMRTFSKLMGIAALRLGVIVSNPKLTHYINNGRLTFDANAVALLFAERLIERPDIIEAMIAEERAGKKRLIELLKEASYEFRECNGNYILVKPKSDPHKLTKWLQNERKMLVHDYGNPVLKDYIRISTGDKESMELIAKAVIEGDAR